LILRAAPIARLVIWIAGIAAVVPILVEPNFEDVAALVATVGLTLAFAFRDYASCLIASMARSGRSASAPCIS
jgi:small conductance mechanosensitive channel